MSNVNCLSSVVERILSRDYEYDVYFASAKVLFMYVYQGDGIKNILARN